MFDFTDRFLRLKLFGQQRRGECSPGRIDARKIFHAAGVVVDRSVEPNRIYIADTGNSRILGFRSFDSPAADIILGQPDASSGAPNGDCNTGSYAVPSATTLCLIDTPSNPNLGEQWMRLNFDVDANGDLHVPDFHNNRVLTYRSPFAKPTPLPRPRGAGDVVADFVIGQDDFQSNGINRGKGPGVCDNRGLHISAGGVDHATARCVSVDPKGNVWVADTFNFRVLRFPRGKTEADLVLGQPDFNTCKPASFGDKSLNRMCQPVVARVDPETGNLYVVDEYPGFRARILVFRPPFTNGQAFAQVIVPKQRLEGDYAAGYQFSFASGLEFNRYKTDEVIELQPPADPPRRYREGVLWVHDRTRTMLLDEKGEILLAIGAPNTITFGGRFDVYGNAGMNPETPFNLVWPGGAIGFDSANNIYLADEHTHRISRYALPYRVTLTAGGKPRLPDSNGGFCPGVRPNNLDAANIQGPGVGAIAYRNQLIVRDTHRYMVWENYLTAPDGSAAMIVGQPDGTTANPNLIHARSMHAIDDRDRLWMRDGFGKLMFYDLPLRRDSQPRRTGIPLVWVDGGNVAYTCHTALAFDANARALWVFDDPSHRLLRVRIPEDPITGTFIVDTVLGQTDKDGSAINAGLPVPNAGTLGDVNDVRFDRFGNLFVVDNTYECHRNARVIMFAAEDLAGIADLFPKLGARLVFVADTFNQVDICRIDQYVDRPYSPVCLAFNSRNEMVLGNDGYYVDRRMRILRQLYLYRNPLKKQTPDAIIELPLGAPGEICFDEQDNLIVQDHIYHKVWVMNFDEDPRCLRELA